ncbi:MAG: FAD/NAD(P)-binding protein [Anaerolineales bacterium]|nr:FAD/NAD(P)-binding protein [Anaerolineales bacterium]
MTPTLLPQPATHTAGHHDTPLTPDWAEIVAITPEADGIATLWLKFTDPQVEQQYHFQPGQFNMLYVPGVGEAAISMSSDPDDERRLVGHTVRFVGNVTRAIGRLKIGDQLGVRGPFGTAWPMKTVEGRDLVVACGGIGLPPLRPALYHVVRNRERYGKVTLLYGARTSKDLLYPGEYEAWRKADITVEATVDRGDEHWDGRVGVVPMWFYNFRLDPRNTIVLTCGPEIMIRFVIYEALARRVPTDRIYVSLERNMKCGQGSCGHCQMGPYFVCKDGPVFPFSALAKYINVEEY